MVLHCAGPFSITSRPMVGACLRNRKHYTDITGEISVFEECADKNDRAFEAGVMLMPGVGFDVVPSDCLRSEEHTSELQSPCNLTLVPYTTLFRSRWFCIVPGRSLSLRGRWSALVCGTESITQT